MNMKRAVILLITLMVIGLSTWFFWPKTKERPPFPDYSPTYRPIPVPTDWSATISAPNTAKIGAPVLVEWTGPAYGGDFLTIVKPDTPAPNYTKAISAQKLNPVTLTAPAEAGEYEVRYVANRKENRIVARQPISILPIQTSIHIDQTTVMAGSAIDINWKGPGYVNDFITIVAADQPDTATGPNVIVRSGSPLRVTLPILEPGDYELRYILASYKKAIARQKITINKVNASIDMADSFPAGQKIPFLWQGPGGDNDVIELHYMPANGRYSKRPLQSIPAQTPGKASFRKQWRTGEYEVRYMSKGKQPRRLAHKRIKVVPRTAPTTSGTENMQDNVVDSALPKP